MAVEHLEVLKKGLKILQKQVKAKKEKLQAQLAQKKSISSQDERWLDHEANLVDEQRILEALEKASDFEKSLEELDDAQKDVIRKLQEAASDQGKIAGDKQKCTHIICHSGEIYINKSTQRL